MIYGNWVAIHKGFTKHLPIDREYTKLEAMFSLSVDIDNKRSVSVSGYSKLWGWSRNKVNLFVKSIGVEFFYPESLGKKQNQRAEAKGQIRDRSWTDDGQIRYIVCKGLQSTKDRKRTDKGQIKDSTIDPDPNPSLKDLSEEELKTSERIKMIIDFLNNKLGTKYTYKADKTVSCIKARLNDGYDGESFKTVINKKYNDWVGTEDAKYLRPETLFGNKFEGYLNQLDKTGKQKNNGAEQAREEAEEIQRYINE